MNSHFATRWMTLTVAVLLAAFLVPGIHYDGYLSLFLASLLLGIFNSLLKPVLVVLSLPIIVLTLGSFVVVINAFLLLLTSHIIRGFHVASYGAAIWGAIIISIVSLILSISEPRKKK